MSTDGSGALGFMGIDPLPRGTLDEIVAQGLDPQLVASCHAARPGVVRGCAVEKECRFHQLRMGGFKGKSGPKYVGYFLQTHEGNKKEDFISCHAFVRTLQARMDAGSAARQKGQAHEIVRVIAQEGEKIVQRIGVPVNPADKTVGASYKYVTQTIEVPRMPRPGENDRLTYDQELTAREQERQQRDQDIENQAWTRPEPGVEEPFDLPAPIAEPEPSKR